MKQIKTIKAPLCKSEDFDKEVNAALREGWALEKRHIIPGQYHGDLPQLVAELEAEGLMDCEPCCENCAFEAFEPGVGPCRECEDASHWNPGEGYIVIEEEPKC